MFIQRANNNFDIQLADIPVTNTYSLDFDGMDDYVETNSKIIGSDITLSGWVNFNGGSYTASVAQFPMSITPSNTSAPNETLGRFIKAGVNMRISIQCYDQNGANYSTYTVPALNFEGAGWQHVCWTYNVTTKHIYVYINGVAQNWLNYSGSVTTPYLTAIGTRLYESDLTIGRQKPTTSTGTYLGLVDEVSTYNRILTQEEITSISAAPTDLTDLNPIAWYRNGDNGFYKSPQWLLPNNENKDKVSNYSFEFDGTDDRVQLSSDFVASGEFTLSFWMKPVAVTGNGNIFPIGTFPDNQNHVRLDQIGVMYLKVQAVLCLFNEGVVGGGANNLVLNEWQHISFIRDSSNVIRCYRNGSSFGATVTNSGTLTLNSIGRVIANTFGFQGGLDEIAYWNSDETANLSTIYNGGEPTTLPSGAVAHYKMGEEANFTSNWLVDNSALDNYSKRSFYFDGTDQYLNAGGLSTLASASSFSISLWVKKRTTSGSYRRGCGKYASVSDNVYIEFSGTNIYPRFYVTNGGVASYVTANVGLTFNTWHNVVVVFNGSLTGNQNRAKIYLDGVNVTATDVGTIPSTTSSDVSDFYFGKVNGVGVFYWLGNQDEAAIFNYPLTPTQVTSVYNSGVPDDLMNTVGVTPPTNNWRMGEDASFNGTNWTVPDNVGTNDGTSVNMDVDDLVGEAPNYSGGGISSGMTIEDRVGNAPNSENNALSFNMESVDRTTDVPT